MRKIIIYSNGIIFCSVCVPKGTHKATIEREVNIINPTGISSGWKISKNKTFRSGNPNPCECNVNSARKHYLMEF